MPQISAGILMYRRGRVGLEVLLAHPGGPFFRKRDDGAWTIPKGLAEDRENLLIGARREFREETGFDSQGEFIQLEPIQQKGGKIIHAWAVEGDLDPAAIRSNTFEMEWPPKSGKREEFPEIDRAEFFDLSTARKKINSAQVEFLDELERLLGA